MMKSDYELLREYATEGSQQAFTTLVERHMNLVYSAARRQLPYMSLAEDVAQATFLVLSRKAADLDEQTILSAWLLRTTRFASLRVLRTESRHHKTEQSLVDMNEPLEQSGNAWSQIEPLLDAALGRLRPNERAAVALRFFELLPDGRLRSFAEVAKALGISEEAAKKRVSRALDKLRLYFLRHSIKTPIEALSAALSAGSVKAAPAGLAARTSIECLSVAAKSHAAALAEQTVRTMLWAKVKSAAALAVVCLLPLAGAGLLSAKLYAAYEDTPRQALRRAAQQFQNGNGQSFVGRLFLTYNHSPQEGSSWKAPIAQLVSAQGHLRRNAVDKFGEGAVRKAMPFWTEIDGIVSRMLAAPDTVDGSSARFPIRMFGQSLPGVPILVRTNGSWKLAADISVVGGVKLAGTQQNSFSIGFGATAGSAQGMNIKLSSRRPIAAADVQLSCIECAKWLTQLSDSIRAGKYDSANAVARDFEQGLEMRFAGPAEH